MENSVKITKTLPGFINVKSAINTLIRSTLTVGILDAIAAIIVYYIFFGFNPIQIYQFVASGILGNEAYKGGIPIALLGLTIHFLIAFTASWLFFIFFSKVPLLRKNKYIVGIIYGLIIWLFMNFIIIPVFSKIPPSPFDVVSVISMLWHITLVGLPISLIINKYYH